MNSLTNLETISLRLGKLCKHKHEHNQTGQSLRYIRDCGRLGDCRECSQMRQRTKLKTKRALRDKDKPLVPTILITEDTFDWNKAELGTLCSLKHDYQGKGLSVRSVVRRNGWIGKCVICDRERSLAFRASRPDIKSTAAVSQWRERNPEKDSVARRQYKTSATGKAAAHRYKTSDAGRSSSRRRRAKIRKVRVHLHTPQQWKQRIKEFSHKCVYCGQSIEKGFHADHFIPLAKDGSDCLSNLVPACPRCNLSKGSRDPWVWYSKQPFYCPKRWQHILKVLGKKDYLQLPLF